MLTRCLGWSRGTGKEVAHQSSARLFRFIPGPGRTATTALPVSPYTPATWMAYTVPSWARSDTQEAWVAVTGEVLGQSSLKATRVRRGRAPPVYTDSTVSKSLPSVVMVTTPVMVLVNCRETWKKCEGERSGVQE